VSAGYEKLKLMVECFKEDIKSYLGVIRTERDYCCKIQQSLMLTHFILNVKPFVCLNFDPNRGGFSLER
jgi:RNase P/RNase MRP subunit POP5